VAAVAAWLVMGTAAAWALPPCRVGAPVTVLACTNRPGHIMQTDAARGRYLVRCDADGDTSWVPASSMQFTCAAQAAAPISIRWFLGRWSTFITASGGHSGTSGALGRPVTIRPDGTYIWEQAQGRPIVGRWRAMQPNELRYNSTGPAILLMRGENGANWQLWRYDIGGADNRDRAALDRVDIGISYQLTRM